MRGEGGFSRVRGVPAHDTDWKLLLLATSSAETSGQGGTLLSASTIAAGMLFGLRLKDKL